MEKNRECTRRVRWLCFLFTSNRDNGDTDTDNRGMDKARVHNKDRGNTLDLPAKGIFHGFES